MVVAALAVAGPAVPYDKGGDHRSGQAPVDHEIKLADTDEAVVGTARALSLTVAPAAGYTISRDAPLTITVSSAAGAGIEPIGRRYQHRDAADQQADAPRFDLRYKAVRAGSYELGVRLAFWVCLRHTCRPVSRDHTVRVTVVPRPG